MPERFQRAAWRVLCFYLQVSWGHVNLARRSAAAEQQPGWQKGLCARDQRQIQGAPGSLEVCD